MKTQVCSDCGGPFPGQHTLPNGMRMRAGQAIQIGDRTHLRCSSCMAAGGITVRPQPALERRTE